MHLPTIVAEITVPLTLGEVATILGIFSVLFSVGAAIVGAKFMPRGAYYAQRQNDLDKAEVDRKATEARLVAVETAVRVLTEADLKAIANAVDGLREEIAGMREASNHLAETLTAFDKRLTLIEAADQGARGKGRR
jgi:hypothetical protein